jgi:16S rRNA (cytosine1402-N4)-methyltransferase
MSIYLPHQSVLAQECLNLLSQSNFGLQSEFWMVDCTFGAGGHSQLFLQAHPNLKILAIDQDKQAIQNGQKLIQDNKLENRLLLRHGNFEDIEAIAQAELSGKKVLIILADIGVSSHHFDDAERGFSYRNDGPLDMRMNQNQEITAEEVINNGSEDELVEIFEKYGEEPFAKKIAKMIISKRTTKLIKTTAELEEICFLAYPPAMRHRHKHPALRVFQALRLYVNQELEVLERALPKWFNILSAGGRLGVISFHSLEDRIVKHTFLKWSKELWSDKVKILTKKPIISSEHEKIHNPRSRSAKLRVVEKISI